MCFFFFFSLLSSDVRGAEASAEGHPPEPSPKPEEGPPEAGTSSAIVSNSTDEEKSLAASRKCSEQLNNRWYFQLNFTSLSGKMIKNLGKSKEHVWLERDLKTVTSGCTIQILQKDTWLVKEAPCDCSIIFCAIIKKTGAQHKKLLH